MCLRSCNEGACEVTAELPGGGGVGTGLGPGRRPPSAGAAPREGMVGSDPTLLQRCPQAGPEKSSVWLKWGVIQERTRVPEREGGLKEHSEKA